MTLEHRLHARCACGSSLSAFEASAAPRPFTLAGTRRVYERDRPFEIRHIALDLVLEPKTKSLAGTARLDVARVDAEAEELVLDAVGFTVTAVDLRSGAGEPHPGRGRRAAHRDGGYRPARFGYDGERLRVTVPRGLATASIRVGYGTTPRRGLYFLEPDEHVKDRPRQVWSQCQDEDARHIFPCHDKPHVKQTMDVRARAPAGWLVLSNGELVGDARAERSGTFHWKMSEPLPSYLFSLVAGEFARIDDSAEGVPLSYWVPKGREADARRTFARTPEMIRHFESLTGVAYPWNKYVQVVVSDFIFGGMENTTATTMYEHILLDERAALDITSDDLIAHELAHQWFGDLVTCRDWSHAWLNEGFATFMEHVDREHAHGRDEYDYHVKGDLDAYLGEARGRYRRPIVCQDYESPIDVFDRHLYEKGGCVLHMLRRELGDAVFWRGVGRYLETNKKGIVETRDLWRALEAVSGRSLERFFEQWVYRAGHPELDVKLEHDGDLTTVTVKQAQATAHGPAEGTAQPFAFDLEIELSVAGKLRREMRRVDQAAHTFSFRVPERPEFVVIDPEMRVLGEVRIEAPGDMLRNQLAKAPTARGRWAAAAALAKVADEPTVRALGAALADTAQFWGVRAEAASALGSLRTDAAFEALAGQTRIKHPKVRRAVVAALGHFKTGKAAELLRPLALHDASYLVEAEAARALGATRQASAFDTLVEVLDRPSWADVIRSGAVDGLANLRDDRGVPHLTARTRYGIPTRGRRAAILALPKLSTDKKTREALEELLDSPDPYLRVDVVRAIAEIGDPKSRGPLQRQLDRDLDGRVRRRIREALRDLGGTGKREADRLRDELEVLRGKHGELEARMSKLESAGATKVAREAAKGAPKGKRRAGPRR